MNDEDLFIFFTQIIEKLDSIDVQLKRLNYKHDFQGKSFLQKQEQEYCCEPPLEPNIYYPPEVYYEPEPIYCPSEEPIYTYEPICAYDPCIDYSCIYNPYYDYTLDYLVPLDEYCYNEIYYYYC